MSGEIYYADILKICQDNNVNCIITNTLTSLSNIQIRFTIGKMDNDKYLMGLDFSDPSTLSKIIKEALDNNFSTVLIDIDEKSATLTKLPEKDVINVISILDHLSKIINQYIKSANPDDQDVGIYMLFSLIGNILQSCNK